MTSLSPSETTGEQNPDSTMPCGQCGDCKCQTNQLVSADLHSLFAQQRYALELYRRTKAAYLRDVAAVEGDPCFFTAMGERHRKAVA